VYGGQDAAERHDERKGRVKKELLSPLVKEDEKQAEKLCDHGQLS